MKTVTLPYDEYIEMSDSMKILEHELLKNTVRVSITEAHFPGFRSERVCYSSNVPEIIQYLEQRKVTAELENDQNKEKLEELKVLIALLEEKIKEAENRFTNKILNYFRR